MTSPGSLRILMLAHDLSDAAAHKRVIMLREGGASVTPAGFRRTAEPIEAIAGARAVNLGRTYAAGFVQRIWSVVREVILLKRHRQLFESADVIIARNLEMLAIGVRGRSLCAKPPTLVYESLDIHRLLLGQGLAASLLRALEGWLSRRAVALMTSSPAFVSGYFHKFSKVKLPVRIIENKVLKTDDTIADQPRLAVRPGGPPWVIGWFGNIRCRKSLDILTHLVQQSDGAVEVIIRGKPAFNEFEDFHKQTSGTPEMRFLGPYKNPEDLASIYESVHFTWAIDMFEEGLNSTWLLPNRLYEGGFYRSVPLAANEVETGHFLQRLGIGVTFDQPLGSNIESFFRNLTKQSYGALADRVEQVPVSTWVDSRADCKELVDYLASLV